MSLLLANLMMIAGVALADDPAAPSADHPTVGPGEMPSCDTLPPDAEFRHFTGYGIAGSEIQALHQAREDAYDVARRNVCAAGWGKRNCERVMSGLAQLDEQAHYVRKGYARRERWRSCFTLQIDAGLVDPEAQRGDFQSNLRSLGMMIQSRHGRGALRVEPPTWAESQCSVGGPGEVLISEIAGAFGPSGVRVEDSDPLGPSLRVSLVEADERLDLLVAHLGADGTESRFPPVRFLPHLYGLEGERQASCLWDRELGLAEGHRAGADGRTVRVVIPGNTGEYCEGDRMEPLVVVDRPSRVRLFSVERDGSALVIWPYMPGMDDLVQRTLPLGQAQVQRPKIGEERLIAVAIPEEESFGEVADWRACKWPAPLDSTAFPPGSAVGSVGFVVAPEGVEGCPQDVTLAAIPELPVCGR